MSNYVCREQWWRNLLYINNFHIDEGMVRRDESPARISSDFYRLQCMGQTWYMALDFQMYLCSPFLLVPMYFIEKKFGKRWSLGFITAFLATMTGVILGLAIAKDWAATMDLAE